MLGLCATVVKHSPNAGSAPRNRHLLTSAASLFDRNPPQKVEVADNLASAQHHNGSSAMHAGSPVSPSTRFLTMTFGLVFTVSAEPDERGPEGSHQPWCQVPRCRSSGGSSGP